MLVWNLPFVILFIFGDALNENDGLEIVYENAYQGIYKSIIVNKEGTSLLGGIMVGDASDYSMLHQIFNRI